MKILVTGSSGFIGTNMVKYLRKLKYSVRTADIKKGKDLRTIKTCLKVTKGIDWVIHLAADNGGSFYLKDNRKCAINNLFIDTAMIEACKLNNVKHFTYASSSCVYPLRNPQNSYGREKLYIEKKLKKSKLSYSIARMQNVYGPKMVIGGKKEMVIPSFCRQILTGKVKVYGDGTQKRSFIYIDDVCEIIFDMMCHKTKLLNIGGQVILLRDLLDILIYFSGINVKIKYGKPIKDRVNRFPKDISTIKLSTGLRRTFKWIKSQ